MAEGRRHKGQCLRHPGRGRRYFSANRTRVSTARKSLASGKTIKGLISISASCGKQVAITVTAFVTVGSSFDAERPLDCPHDCDQ